MKKIPIRQLGPSLQELHLAERFKIRRVEDILGGTDLVHDLHYHDFFFILALKTGSGKHEINFTAYNVTDNSVFFIRPGQVHHLELKACCTGYLVEFNADFYHPKDKLSMQRLRKASNKNYCELEMIRFNELQTILSSMLDEYTSKDEEYQDVIKSNLDIFFIEFVRQSSNPRGIQTAANSYTRSALKNT